MRMALLVVSLWLVTSPLEGKIVFSSFRDGNEEIYVMASDGKDQTRLTFNEAHDSYPVWSPNGHQIAFHSIRDGNWEVYVMDADGGNQRRLTRHPGLDGFAVWSPDGSQIAFRSARAAKELDHELDIFVMDADGSNVKQLTDLGFATRPKWSPDGEWILFEGSGVHGRQIYAIRPDGTGRWQVSNPIPNVWMLLGGWAPDGKQVLYTESVGLDVKTSFPVVATLAPNGRAEVIQWKRVKVPPMAFDTPSFSADGASILFAGRAVDAWNLYRFGRVDKKLIQLTAHLGGDYYPHEWNPRLPVSPQGLTPKRWGEIKSN